MKTVKKSVPAKIVVTPAIYLVAPAKKGVGYVGCVCYTAATLLPASTGVTPAECLPGSTSIYTPTFARARGGRRREDEEPEDHVPDVSG